MPVRSTQEVLLESAAAVSLVRSSQEVLLISIPYTAMSIAYPVSPPAISGIGPEDFTMIMVNVVGETESPFTLGQQEQQWPGQELQFELNLPPMLLAQAEQWIAFLGSLFGKFGTFLMGDYNRLTPQGPMSGGAVVSGSNASGLNVLNLRGATPSVTNWAIAGDYLQLTVSGNPQRIYKILQNASTDPSGNVTLQIFPNLRETVPDGNAIVTANCQGTFRLQDNSSPKWKVDKNKTYSISFKAKEAI
jgi:hypothetical protein